MTRLASRFGSANSIRRDRPLTTDELYRTVPSVFSEDKHDSRSERYSYIPTITLLDSLQKEGFTPFFACQTRVRDISRRACQWQFNFDPFKASVGNLQLTPLTTLQTRLAQCLFYAYPLNDNFHR